MIKKLLSLLLLSTCSTGFDKTKFVRDAQGSYIITRAGVEFLMRENSACTIKLNSAIEITASGDITSSGTVLFSLVEVKSESTAIYRYLHNNTYLAMGLKPTTRLIANTNNVRSVDDVRFELFVPIASKNS